MNASIAPLFLRTLRSVASNLPSSAMGSSTFSRAVREDMRLKAWNTKPMFSRRVRARSASLVPSLTSTPHTRSRPLVGWSMRPMMFSMVVLPPPLVP